MVKAKTGRGGKRPGAGRKPQHGEPMVTVALKAPPSLKRAFYEWCAARDVEPAAILRWAIRDIIDGKWSPSQFK